MAAYERSAVAATNSSPSGVAPTPPSEPQSRRNPHVSSLTRHLKGLRPVSPFRPRKRPRRRRKSRGRNGETQGGLNPAPPKAAPKKHSTAPPGHPGPDGGPRNRPRNGRQTATRADGQYPMPSHPDPRPRSSPSATATRTELGIERVRPAERRPEDRSARTARTRTPGGAVCGRPRRTTGTEPHRNALITAGRRTPPGTPPAGRATPRPRAPRAARLATHSVPPPATAVAATMPVPCPPYPLGPPRPAGVRVR